MDFILKTWDWYIAGPLIGLFVPLLLIIGNKAFGISSSFMHVCSIILPDNKKKLLNYDNDKHAWKFHFVIGILIGGFVSVYLLSDSPTHFLPEHYYHWTGFIKLFIGGLLIGFGTRYGDGCTSGHAITGLSLLKLSSLKATIAFFAGGLIYTIANYYLF
jgi:uncharacterized membrane protein YedE/YeeE